MCECFHFIVLTDLEDILNQNRFMREGTVILSSVILYFSFTCLDYTTEICLIDDYDKTQREMRMCIFLALST